MMVVAIFEQSSRGSLPQKSLWRQSARRREAKASAKEGLALSTYQGSRIHVGLAPPRDEVRYPDQGVEHEAEGCRTLRAFPLPRLGVFASQGLLDVPEGPLDGPAAVLMPRDRVGSRLELRGEEVVGFVSLRIPHDHQEHRVIPTDLIPKDPAGEHQAFLASTPTIDRCRLPALAGAPGQLLGAGEAPALLS